MHKKCHRLLRHDCEQIRVSTLPIYWLTAKIEHEAVNKYIHYIENLAKSIKFEENLMRASNCNISEFCIKFGQIRDGSGKKTVKILGRDA